MKSQDKIKSNALNAKICMVILLLAIINTCTAQTVAQEREAHQKIKTFIKDAYPAAKSIWILDECWGYRTTFKTPDGKYVSTFSLSDQWLKTERKINMSDIPDNVKEGLKSTKYKGAKVLTTKQITQPQEPSVSYVMEIRSIQHNDNLNDNYGLAYTNDYKLYFTASGQLTKEEKEQGETLQSLPWGGQ